MTARGSLAGPVRIFPAEKGLAVARVEVDLRGGEQRAALPADATFPPLLPEPGRSGVPFC